jgi:hypothetical protein
MTDGELRDIALDIAKVAGDSTLAHPIANALVYVDWDRLKGEWPR